MNNKHLTRAISTWKKRGLNETKERRIEIYWIRESSTNCEKCGKEFKSNKDRNMDHCHITGKYRNILCTSCNSKRRKLTNNNKSGYIGISKRKDPTCKQGFIWEFNGNINKKYTKIKSSTNKDWLIEYAEQWKKDNHYND